MLKKIPTFWLIVFGIMLTSAISLGLMVSDAIQTTTKTVTKEQISQLFSRAQAYSLFINERLHAFDSQTQLVAVQAKVLMLKNDLPAEERTTRLQKYQRNANNVYGLDHWYETNYEPKYKNGFVSNVFLNNRTNLTPQLETVIATTEDLDPLFQSVKNSNLGSQWIYLTLPSGMMRLYPYTASSGYPVDWQPEKQTFYTVADQIRNPERKSIWTTPYNDFAGAGLMVTNSLPIYDGDALLGVVSNDFLIKDIQKGILSFKVGIDGYAFLLDKQGNVIANKNYAPENTPKGEEINIKLADEEPYLKGVIENILNGNSDTEIITNDNTQQKWVVVYTPIAETDWHLGLMQPLSEIVQPATDIANQVKYGAGGLVLLALVVALMIARWISYPVTQLSKKARFISETVDVIDTSIEKQPNSLSTNTNYSDANGTKEIYELGIMFDEMVTTLQKRINELGSIYTLGQTIGATVEYEKSLETVLSAVKRTIKPDSAEIHIVRKGQWTVEISSGHLDTKNNPSTNNILIPESLIAKIFQKKSSLLITKETQEYQSSEEEIIGYLKAKKIYSLLIVPLMIDEKRLGLVSLENYGNKSFTEDNERQLNRLAALASIAINNAIQVRQREQALKEQISELKIEIDQNKMKKEVSQIVESDYFQTLQKRASEIRARTNRKTDE